MLLTLPDLTCGCACEHNSPSQDVYVGRNLIDRMPGIIEKRGLGSHCVLVADATTWNVAGKRAAETLKRAGFTVQTCILTGDGGEMFPDERSCGEVLLSILPDTEFLVSVGSGTVTDTVRLNATRTGLPFVCVGTAPSMDGYISVVAPLLLRKFKIQRAGVCPDIILCDLDILATAPDHMIAWGVGDVLGKYIAKADWIIGNIINDEPCCPLCLSIVTDAANQLMENVEAIRDKTEMGMRILIEALLLSGLSGMIVGHTRPVASVEHNMAQFWEMKQLMLGKEPPPHGSSVGVSTLLMLPLFKRFAQEDLSRLDLDDIRARRITREARERFVLSAYGEQGGSTIIRDNPGDFLTWEEQERRIRRAQERFEDIRAAIDEMPDVSQIEHVMRTLGAHMTPAEEGIDNTLLSLSMRCAKDYRERYTLLKTIDECGLLDQYLHAYQ